MDMLDAKKHISSLVKVNSALNWGVQNHYRKLGLTYVDVPEIVGITGACENVDTLFKVGNRLSVPLFMTQTGQLSLEQSLQYYSGVYTLIHSGRDEEFEDERHLRQFRLIEEEFDCTLAGMTRANCDDEKMFTALLDHIEHAVQAAIMAVVEECGEELRNQYDRDVDWLKEVGQRPFFKIPYEEAIVILGWNGFPNIKFGDDLKANHEETVVNLVNQKLNKGKEGKRLLPVFITKYPKEIKFFNMKVSLADPRVVMSADLILPLSGEAAGSAVREHDGDKLKDRLLSSTMYELHIGRGGTYEDFKWYVDGIVNAGKTNPHAGYGIGNERVIQFILGKNDIRECSLFSLLTKESGDWDVSKSGKMYLFSADKKMVLLSIGKEINKKKLLPTIKKLTDSNFVFYATEKTHHFLNNNNINSTLVYKISENGKPNIKDLLRENFFDVIVNIPTHKFAPNSELTDGRRIRKEALRTKAALITDMQVAEDFLREYGVTSKIPNP